MAVSSDYDSNENVEICPCQGGAEPPEMGGVHGRRAYSAPCLRKFGAVVDITKKSGSPPDGSAQPHSTSDRSAKERIVRVGQHQLGIGLYLFDYKLGLANCSRSGRQFGVMADEVERVMPEAVSIAPNGLKQVDYSMLGIELAA